LRAASGTPFQLSEFITGASAPGNSHERAPTRNSQGTKP